MSTSADKSVTAPESRLVVFTIAAHVPYEVGLDVRAIETKGGYITDIEDYETLEITNV